MIKKQNSRARERVCLIKCLFHKCENPDLAWPGPPALTNKLSTVACVSHHEEMEALGDGGSVVPRYWETDGGTGRPRKWGIEAWGDRDGRFL